MSCSSHICFVVTHKKHPNVQKDEINYREFFELSLLYAKIPVSVDFLSTEILQAKSILRNVFSFFQRNCNCDFLSGENHQRKTVALWGIVGNAINLINWQCLKESRHLWPVRVLVVYYEQGEAAIVSLSSLSFERLRLVLGLVGFGTNHLSWTGVIISIILSSTFIIISITTTNIVLAMFTCERLVTLPRNEPFLPSGRSWKPPFENKHCFKLNKSYTLRVEFGANVVMVPSKWSSTYTTSSHYSINMIPSRWA